MFGLFGRFAPVQFEANGRYHWSLRPPAVGLLTRTPLAPSMTAFTLLVLWTAFGSVFALLLGYSRIPYAAAADGTFFKVFAKVHPDKRFPHVSLLLIGLIAIVASTLSLGMVIDALITTRILIQFMGQIVAVALLRRDRPDLERPFRIWLYPLPNLIALAGWLFVFSTSGATVILFGLVTLAAGVGAFGLWTWRTRQWPFALARPN